MQIRVHDISPRDAPVWERLRRDLWPDGAGDHAAEIASFFAGTLDEPTAVLVAENREGAIVAFTELSIRDNLPGLEGKRVGYVEGLYVVPEARHRGIGRRLLHESRRWARDQKCAVFASDRAERVVVDKGF